LDAAEDQVLSSIPARTEGHNSTIDESTACLLATTTELAVNAVAYIDPKSELIANRRS
jgi:hypothetical protein